MFKIDITVDYWLKSVDTASLKLLINKRNERFYANKYENFEYQYNLLSNVPSLLPLPDYIYRNHSYVISRDVRTVQWEKCPLPPETEYKGTKTINLSFNTFQVEH